MKKLEDNNLKTDIIAVIVIWALVILTYICLFVKFNNYIDQKVNEAPIAPVKSIILNERF